MDYWQFQIDVAESWREILQAFLSELPFESFEESEKGLLAYMPVSQDLGPVEEQLAELALQYPFTWALQRLEDQNWNAAWEAGFQPIRVGDFCGIRADFHEPLSGVRHELVINPKMSFGTGHHATTYLMIETMGKYEWAGARVLDFGSGTGILAILAARLGAAQVDAVDIEEPAFENARENAQINGVAGRLSVFLGDLTAIPEGNYQYILANINRNVIWDSLPTLYEKLAPSGVLFVSGILREDEPGLLPRAQSFGFKIGEGRWSGEWACRVLEK